MPPGGSMNISASGASTYTWTPNTTSQNAANSLVTITGAGAGKTTFTVTGTDGNGCIGSDTIDIYVRNIVAGELVRIKPFVPGTCQMRFRVSLLQVVVGTSPTNGRVQRTM